MYSGFITSRHAADWLGAHQKFNKIAYKQLHPHVQASKFPPLDRIQHFEGMNGPDGIKLKSIHRSDEPSHFYNPDTKSGPLLDHIKNHHQSLVVALGEQNISRAAFEAAWLAHTVVDGLTPAHHVPYEQELHEMYQSGGQNFHRRRNKVIIQGATKRDALRQNWQMWGKDGLLSNHIHFELGVATVVIGSSFRGTIHHTKLKGAQRLGVVDFFKTEAKIIHHSHMYDQFQQTSWTAELARTVRRQLAPAIIQAVAIVWILAAEEAGIGVEK